MGEVLADYTEQAAAVMGLVQRRSNLTGRAFMQTLGAPISPQARFRQFTPRQQSVCGKSWRQRWPR